MIERSIKLVHDNDRRFIDGHYFVEDDDNNFYADGWTDYYCVTCKVKIAITQEKECLSLSVYVIRSVNIYDGLRNISELGSCDEELVESMLIA